MNTQIATEATRPQARRSVRVLAVLWLGPLTALAGIVWAVLQPYRVTLFDPHGQGFWWLFSEPPLYVILVGVLFHVLVVPGVVADLEEAEARVPGASLAKEASEGRAGQYTLSTAKRPERSTAFGDYVFESPGRGLALSPGELPRAASGGGGAGLRPAGADAGQGREQ